nr:hypothetical protein [Tanacetum cinerariifolium]
MFLEVELIREGFSNGEVGEIPATRVNLVESGVTCDGSPKDIEAGKHDELLSKMTNDDHMETMDALAGKHDELLSKMTNDDHMETMDALGTICNSIQADNNNAYVNPYKVLHVADLINLIVDESTTPSDPIVQSVDINTKSTSYVGAAGASAKEQPKVNSNFRTLGTDPVFISVNISIPHKVVKKKKRKGKSKSTNGGQFVSMSVKQNVRYKPKATTSAPKKGVTNVGNTSQSSSMLKTTGNSFKKDNLSMSNSFSALNDKEEDDEEDVENVYDESAKLIQNTKAGGRSSFTAAVG